MAEVREAAGVPAAAAFGGVGPSWPGTPIVVDKNQGDLYVLVGGVPVRTAAAAMRYGAGAPSNGVGSDGNYYFRSDGSAGAYIYFKAAGAWGAIL